MNTSPANFDIHCHQFFQTEALPGLASPFTCPKHSNDIRVHLIGNVHYRQYTLKRCRIRGGRRRLPFQQNHRIPAVEDDPLSSEGAQEPAVREVDPPDFLGTIRVGLLACDPDMTVGLACSPFGDKYAVSPRG